MNPPKRVAPSPADVSFQGVVLRCNKNEKTRVSVLPVRLVTGYSLAFLLNRRTRIVDRYDLLHA
jgi:hypothetical protein